MYFSTPRPPWFVIYLHQVRNRRSVFMFTTLSHRLQVKIYLVTFGHVGICSKWYTFNSWLKNMGGGMVKTKINTISSTIFMYDLI